jgi:5-formyltetrahydrofolate cyclo-ligase
MNENSILPNKSSLRRIYRAERDSMSADELRGKSTALCRQLLSWWQGQRGIGQVFLFKAIGSEVQLDEFAEAVEGTVPLALPVCAEKGEMHFYLWSPGDPLQANRWGVSEPLPSQTRLLKPDATTVVLVPCLAADIRGHRLGYGAGFYDRFLGSNFFCTKIGVLWQQQIIASAFSADDHDIAMDLLCSEREITVVGRDA